MSKHQNETISSRESHVCHLTHAGQTARFWQFGRPVLGGNFWFPRWNSFILVFWHLYKAYLNVFTWICLLTFFFTSCCQRFGQLALKKTRRILENWILRGNLLDSIDWDEINQSDFFQKVFVFFFKLT